MAEKTQSATDWHRLLRIAARHRVSGLVAHGLREAKVAVPDAVAASLARAESRIALSNVRAAAESHRLMGALAADGINALLLKGVTLNMLAYGGLWLKESRDIDLLVAPEAFLAASRTLTAAGYERFTPAPSLDDAAAQAWIEGYKESAWLHRSEGHLVELHIRLADNKTLIAGIGLDSPRQRVELGGGMSVETLAEGELFAYLFLHGSTHGWARLKWLADVNALLAVRSHDAIDAAYRCALSHGAGRGAAQGLLLCERLLGLDLGDRLKEELEADSRTRYMVRVAIDLIAGRFVETELDDSRFGTVHLNISHFFLQRGLRAKAAVLAQKLSTPFGATDTQGKMPLVRGALKIPLWLWRRARRTHKAGGPPA